MGQKVLRSAAVGSWKLCPELGLVCSMPRTRAAVSCRRWLEVNEQEKELWGVLGGSEGNPRTSWLRRSWLFLRGYGGTRGWEESCLIWSSCRTANAMGMAVSSCWECQGGSDPQEAAGILLETRLGQVGRCDSEIQ